MAVKPPVVMPEAKILRSVSGNWERISGTSSTLNPNEKLNAITKNGFTVNALACNDSHAQAATVPNISNVAPPKTGSGIKENTKPMAGKSPNKTKKPAMKYPT